jgi:hypothetical protein
MLCLRARDCLRLFWALILSFTTAGALGRPVPKRSVVFGRNIEFGMQAVTVGDTCYLVGGTLSAEDFFLGLRKTVTDAGPEFHKGKNPLEYFPSKLHARVALTGAACHGTIEDDASAERIARFAQSIRFEAHWKTGTNMRPVESLTVNHSSLQRRKPQARPLFNRPGEPQQVWIYELGLATKEVPLTDHLILSLLTSDGTTIARLSASL